MTFNPDWPDVKAQSRPGQSATDIPIVVARVFLGKSQAMVVRETETSLGV
jgi:hypothetical protein